MKYIIWHDNDYDLAYWLFRNSNLKNFKVQLRSIPKTNSSGQIRSHFKDPITKKILPFIRFETPDLIIQMIEPINKVICVTELMTHTPQWQHPAQRFARIYSSTMLNVPTALILPENKTKWERGKNTNYRKVSYTCSPSVYTLFVKATEKGDNPTLLFHWPEKDGYLKYDSSSPTAPYLTDEIIDWFNFVNLCIEKNGVLEKNDYKKQFDVINAKKEDLDTETFTTIESFSKTKEFLKKYDLLDKDIPQDFLNREMTLVFKPSGLKSGSSRFRTDPYAGMLCAFDVIFCRDYNFVRKHNLVLVAHNVEFDNINYISNNHDENLCPFIHTDNDLNIKHLKHCTFTQPKYRRIYGEVADLVIFDNGTVMRKGVKL